MLEIENPMESLSTRLQKLEKDLHLISTIQNILTSEDDDGPINLQNLNLRQIFPQDAPERDGNQSSQNPKPPSKGNKGTCKKLGSTIGINRNKALRPDPPASTIGNGGQGEGFIPTPRRNEEARRPEITDEPILQKVEIERKRRMEVEESAGRVVLKLKKTEDELQRERETKKHLLVGTLELKNQLQSYENRISHLQSQINLTQNEKQNVSSILEKLSQEKVDIEQLFKSQLDLLQKDKTILAKQNEEVYEELRILQDRCESLKRDCQRKEESLNLQDERLGAELEQAVSKSSQIEKEKDQLAIQLQESITKLKELKEESESQISHYKLMDQKKSSELIEQTTKVKRLESDIKAEKVRLESQVAHATGLVCRTKSFIISLQHQRDNSLKELKQLKDKSHRLCAHKEKSNKKEEILTQEVTVLKDRLANLLQNNLEKGRKFQDERVQLDRELKNLRMENEIVLKNHDILKSQIELQTIQNDKEKDIFQGDIAKLKNELKRITDNFQVLQKISEDQGKTITKQRGDLDASQNLSHGLQVQLRESQETEKVLAQQLSSEQKSCQLLESQVSQLEDQLNAMEKDLREHNCEDEVENKWKSRVDEMETDLQSRFTSWQRSLRSLEKERDLALTAARKALRQSEAMQDSCESRLLKMKSTSTQQVSKLEQEKHEVVNEKSKKIQELESELLRTKQTSSQMQRAYSAKIQQLQTALNACLGNPTPSFSCVGGFGDVGSIGTII